MQLAQVFLYIVFFLFLPKIKHHRDVIPEPSDSASCSLHPPFSFILDPLNGHQYHISGNKKRTLESSACFISSGLESHDSPVWFHSSVNLMRYGVILNNLLVSEIDYIATSMNWNCVIIPNSAGFRCWLGFPLAVVDMCITAQDALKKYFLFKWHKATLRWGMQSIGNLAIVS